MTALKTPLGRLRLVGLTEGVSYLLLLGVAMPLKWLAGRPLAVEIVGPVHGTLWLLMLAAIAHVWYHRRWPAARAAAAVLASLLPAGPFVLDRSLRREEHESPPGDPTPGPSP